jgi:TM2 domain-containing membrane protein YozV
MSKKRILPALILAGTVGFIGLHRIYAGRIVTGLVQLVLFSVGAILMQRDLTGIFSIQSLDDYLDWATSHQIHPLPVLLVAIPVFWAIYDCGLLLGRRFKDGAGNVITTWV